MSLATKSATELKGLLERREISSVELVEAMLAWGDQTIDGEHRRTRVNGFTIRDDKSALRQAAQLDRERAAGQIRGPLHGLVITVKDSMDVEGLPTTLGLAKRRYLRATQDAVVVHAARALGAVILGKSNVPQMLASGMECENPVWGCTTNPWSKLHGPGGSSGGEAALVASGESLMGLGSDLGGSIRSPAIYCGVVGFKPTSHRWSGVGLVKALNGQDFVPSQSGPITRTVDDARLLFESIASFPQGALDPRVPPYMPAAKPSIRGMRIGYYEDDGLFRPSPAIIRALREARNTLIQAGAEVVDFVPVDQSAVFHRYLSAISSDGMDGLRAQLHGEEIAHFLSMAWRAGNAPRWVRKSVSRMLSLGGEQRLADALASTGRRSVAEYWSLNSEKDAFIRAELAAWDRAGIDAVLCPGSVTPAVPIGASANFAQAFAYTARYNMLGNPAGVLPVALVQNEDLIPRFKQDRLDHLANGIDRQSLGLPVGVQVVARPWQDHVCLEVMAAIEAGVTDAVSLLTHRAAHPIRNGASVACVASD